MLRIVLFFSFVVSQINGFSIISPFGARKVAKSKTIPFLPPYLQSTNTDSDDDYYNSEPDDSELAKLGEELNDFKGEAVTEEEEEIPATPKSVAFEDSINDDEDLSLEEEEEELAIEFDSDDDEDEKGDGNNIDGEEDVAIVSEESADDYYDDEYEYEEDDSEDVDEDNDKMDRKERKRYNDLYGSVSEEDEQEYELQNDDDPNYMIQKELVEKNMANLRERLKEREKHEKSWRDLATAMDVGENSYEDENFVENFNAEAVENGEETYEPQWSDEIAEKVKALMDPDNDDYMTVDPENVKMIEDRFQGDQGSDDSVDPLEAAHAEIDQDFEEVGRAHKTYGDAVEELSNLMSTKFDENAPKSKIMNFDYVSHIGMSGSDAFDHIPNETMQEITDCMIEMGSASYNVTKWLVYDIDFNVTNLMLAACKHNPKAPIIFEHWFPQLQVYERYQYARDRDFSFTWEDVNNSDIKELELYYRGFGYFEIPKKYPGETGIIDLEELDEQEMRMAGFAQWVQDVYNPEWDRKDFDDDNIKDMDNVFSDHFVMPRHPDLPTFEDAKEDIRNWKGEISMLNNDEVSKEQEEYRDMLGKEMDYTLKYDEEFDREFRGHLIIACTDEEEDLEIAEKITIGCEKKFGKQVYVETRICDDALKEDNVFEIWLESYDIELLHSKRRASIGYKDWKGPEECDDEEIERLLEKVGYLISDDARYSYRMDMDCILN